MSTTDPDIVTRLRNAPWTTADDCNAAADEIERLRAERDEARRMWCEAAPVGNFLSVDDMDRRARAEATRRGWDCFKDDTAQDHATRRGWQCFNTCNKETDNVQ